ncbi:biotin-dependent carboxyltransferase family protein [Paenibacillus sp. L3-i20]|uniref:5-oxoprolinase subunit C family protein n=1 Tax=Paenibacillus sp. L3-i20 TaxID=2905833 RepID=UPI001EE09961|nr:biotin-dependent carboxyltransferase family protein [Paenibacillus sp. L3-i20]GKU80552.1 KipI antagonist [Paenibacillus sp. L3-i20]
MTITVLKPGTLATIQDLGRTGHQRFGIVVGGAMDLGAARVANIVVGNEENEAVLELTLAGGEFLIERELLISLCGADLNATVDGQVLPLWRPVVLQKGQVIKLGTSRFGCRAYLAVAGGFDVPQVMGSRSTYTRGGLGGYEGRAIKAGDRLKLKKIASLSLSAKLISAVHEKRWRCTWHAGQFAIANRALYVVRVTEGAHSKGISDEARALLFGGIFRIDTLSDRMGYRLQSDQKLTPLYSTSELLSEAVAIGTIQLPPDGNPIVLLADRQTTGGYPRVAHVATVDIAVFAQMKPGDRVIFELITQRAAEILLLAAERDIEMLKVALQLKGKE